MVREEQRDESIREGSVGVGIRVTSKRGGANIPEPTRGVLLSGTWWSVEWPSRCMNGGLWLLRLQCGFILAKRDGDNNVVVFALVMLLLLPIL